MGPTSVHWRAEQRYAADEVSDVRGSPFSKSNSVDHTRTDQTSILSFIEDNWKTGRIGDASFDTRAGSLAPMFDFRHHPNTRPVLLNPITAAVTKH